jgi:molybdopterin synthase sulfur carrier subunit
MKITVRYFAMLRERAGCDAEELAWPDAEPTVARLRALLAERTPGLAAPLASGSVLVAVNREYAGPATALRDGDEVAFFPPVTGG